MAKSQQLLILLVFLTLAINSTASIDQILVPGAIVCTSINSISTLGYCAYKIKKKEIPLKPIISATIFAGSIFSLIMGIYYYQKSRYDCNWDSPEKIKFLSKSKNAYYVAGILSLISCISIFKLR